MPVLESIAPSSCWLASVMFSLRTSISHIKEICKHFYVPASNSSDKPSRNTGFPSLKNKRQVKGEALTATNLQPLQACLLLFMQMLPPDI
jgi:hypothetical protein